ncbi:MAG TPA: hypothetical protein VGM83_00605 [Devosiaceae bacterium]|jgi:hypothetical protein
MRRTMDTDLTAQLVGMSVARTQTLAQYSIIKKQHEMDMSLIDMLANAAKSVPPTDGTGFMVDKTA